MNYAIQLVPTKKVLNQRYHQLLQLGINWFYFYIYIYQKPHIYNASYFIFFYFLVKKFSCKIYLLVFNIEIFYNLTNW